MKTYIAPPLLLCLEGDKQKKTATEKQTDLQTRQLRQRSRADEHEGLTEVEATANQSQPVSDRQPSKELKKEEIWSTVLPSVSLLSLHTSTLSLKPETWCPPSLEEKPAEKTTSKKLQKKNLQKQEHHEQRWDTREEETLTLGYEFLQCNVRRIRWSDVKQTSLSRNKTSCLLLKEPVSWLFSTVPW